MDRITRALLDELAVARERRPGAVKDIQHQLTLRGYAGPEIERVEKRQGNAGADRQVKPSSTTRRR